MNMEEVKTSLISDLEKVNDLKELNDLKVEYLGKKGKITELNQMIKDIPNEEKKEFGQKVNELRTMFNDIYEEKKNAFEAAIKSKEKSVELSVTRNLDQSIIVISVINSCDSISSSDANGYFLTTKQNRSGHGIGLRSIKRIVKKHNGVSTMYFDENTHKFHHIIQFPFSSNSVEAVSMDRS